MKKSFRHEKLLRTARRTDSRASLGNPRGFIALPVLKANYLSKAFNVGNAIYDISSTVIKGVTNISNSRPKIDPNVTPQGYYIPNDEKFYDVNKGDTISYQEFMRRASSLPTNQQHFIPLGFPAN